MMWYRGVKLKVEPIGYVSDTGLKRMQEMPPRVYSNNDDTWPISVRTEKSKTYKHPIYVGQKSQS